MTEGGAVKMSKVAVRRTTVEAGTDWQPSEEQEQIAVFEWVTIMRNQYPDLDLLLHIPNGGLRSKSEAVRFKRMGVKPGVPDLFLPVPRGSSHGLFVEMKRRKGGRLSEEQKEWADALMNQNYTWICANGAEEACDAIFAYLTGE